MFRKNKLFFWTSEILLLTIIFYLWRQMGGIMTPFVSVANTIMIPFLLGGFLRSEEHTSELQSQR